MQLDAIDEAKLEELANLIAERLSVIKERMLTAEDLMKALSISRATLRTYSKMPGFPQPIELPGGDKVPRLRYFPHEVNSWLKSRQG